MVSEKGEIIVGRNEFIQQTTFAESCRRSVSQMDLGWSWQFRVARRRRREEEEKKVKRAKEKEKRLLDGVSSGAGCSINNSASKGGWKEGG